jgi:hypothetical protein
MSQGKVKENLELFCFTFETKINLEQMRCDMWIGLESCPISIMQLRKLKGLVVNVGQTPRAEYKKETNVIRPSVK